MKNYPLIEKLILALQKSGEFSYNIALIRLVDGVSTYELSYRTGDGKTTIQFSEMEDAYEYIAEKKYHQMAEAVLDVVKEVPIRPQDTDNQLFVIDIEWSQTDKDSVIISAVDKEQALVHAKRKYPHGRYISCVRTCDPMIEVAGA
jgi:hypothetical protein